MIYILFLSQSRPYGVQNLTSAILDNRREISKNNLRNKERVNHHRHEQAQKTEDYRN